MLFLRGITDPAELFKTTFRLVDRLDPILCLAVSMFEGG